MSNRWQYCLIQWCSRLVCCLSYPRILAIGKRLGPMILNRVSSAKRRGLEQIESGLGVSHAEAERLLQHHFSNLGMMIMELLYTPRLVKEKTDLAQYVTIDYPERLRAALDEGRGVVGLTAHFGNWEWLGAGLALYGFPTTTIAKRQPNDQITRILNEYREMAGLDVFYSGGSDIIGAARAMKRKKILGFLADKDGDRDGVPVMFLGRLSSTVEGPAVFARRFHAPVVPLFIRRRESGIGHVICVGEPYHYTDTGDLRADTDREMQKMTTIMETFIRRYPTEWLWIQRRWWTAPEDIRRAENRQGDDHETN